MTISVVRESAVIHAPMARLFALSTSIDLVRKTLGMTPMETGVERGLTSGHVVGESRVVWRGWKFGLPTQHHTLITGFTPPQQYVGRVGEHDVTAEAFFQDTQERGRFAFFQHDHHFYEYADARTGAPVTELRDEVRFVLPLGVLGQIAARVLMKPYVAQLCRQRFAMLKGLAEGEGWRPYVVAEG
jgi:ligand-binding SRPBCC domain-containing protein